MEERKTMTVEMTEQERAEFEAFQAQRAARAAEEQKRRELEAYNALVDECIAEAMPTLASLSEDIAATKAAVIEQFRRAIELKNDLLRVKEGQRSHTFTNSEGTMRITLGYYTRDDYRDTVEEGIMMVREAIESLGKDDDSRALVAAVLRLLSRDQKGTLKASRVLQLQKLADDSGNERFKEGVRIIRDSYQPTVSKQFIRAEVKAPGSEWKSIALGMTES